MKKFLFSFFFFLVMLSLSKPLSAQQENNPPANNAGEIHGNLQTDAQYYSTDTSIGATPVPEKMLMNGFANINYVKGNFTAGLRYESYLNTIQGFDPRYKGNGIPYRYATYKARSEERRVGKECRL